MAFESEWAKAIRGRAAELGLNQVDIGRILGMSKQTGHRIWRGEQRPTETQCDELEEALVYPEGELRVLCGYLPIGCDPKLERTEDGIVVRLTPGRHNVDHRPKVLAGDWFPRPIDVYAEADKIAA